MADELYQPATAYLSWDGGDEEHEAYSVIITSLSVSYETQWSATLPIDGVRVSGRIEHLGMDLGSFFGTVCVRALRHGTVAVEVIRG